MVTVNLAVWFFMHLHCFVGGFGRILELEIPSNAHSFMSCCCGSLGSMLREMWTVEVWFIALQEEQGLKNWNRNHSCDTWTSSLCWLVMLGLGNQV